MVSGGHLAVHAPELSIVLLICGDDIIGLLNMAQALEKLSLPHDASATSDSGQAAAGGSMSEDPVIQHVRHLVFPKLACYLTRAYG